MDIVINHRSAQQVDGCSGQYSIFNNPDWGNDKVVKHDSLCNGGYTVPDNCGPGIYAIYLSTFNIMTIPVEKIIFFEVFLFFVELFWKFSMAFLEPDMVRSINAHFFSTPKMAKWKYPSPKSHSNSDQLFFKSFIAIVR